MDGINLNSRKNENIVLVGFPGHGKCALRLLRFGQLSGWQLRDTDALIEEDQGMPIPELFSSKGERISAKWKVESSPRRCAVASRIATGGGAVLAKQIALRCLPGIRAVGVGGGCSYDSASSERGQQSAAVHGDMEARVRQLMTDRHGTGLRRSVRSHVRSYRRRSCPHCIA